MAKNMNKPNQGGPAAKTKSVEGQKQMSRRRWLLGAGAVALGGAGIYLAKTMGQSQAREYTYEVVNRYRHNTEAFTQGLVYYQDDILYEGTGRWNLSRLLEVQLQTGEWLRDIPLPNPRMFGEGIALWNDTIIQLTWEHRVAFVWDRATFQELRRFTYEGEGWGLTHDGHHLIMSNGSDVLTFRDPDTFAVVRELPVRDGFWKLAKLNELEYIEGEIYANVWQQDWIARISPETGQVIAKLDLTGLLPPGTIQDPLDEVLNGIAWDAEGRRLFVTGKHWPWLFEIRQVPR